MSPEEAKLICRTAKTIDDGTEIELLQVADLIESLTAERDGLAGLVVQMREALEKIAWKKLLPHAAESVADAAISAPPTAAEAQARKWREKAELLDWMLDDGMSDLYVEDLESVGDPSCEPHPYVVLSYRLPDKYMAADCEEDHPFFDDPFQSGKQKLLEALRAAREEASDA